MFGQGMAQALHEPEVWFHDFPLFPYTWPSISLARISRTAHWGPASARF